MENLIISRKDAKKAKTQRKIKNSFAFFASLPLRLKYFFKIFFLCIVLVSNTFANPHKLQQLQTQIQTIKSSLTAEQNQYQEFAQQLQQTETNIGNGSLHLQQTHLKLSQQKKSLRTLKLQQLRYQTQLQIQQAALAQQLHTMYLMGQQPYLKVLLNQQDPNQLDRMLTYYHYIEEQRLQLITQFSQTLAVLQQTTHAIQTHTQQLTVLNTQQQKQQQSLIKNSQQRKQLLNSLDNRMKTKQQQLQILLANKRALEQVVQRLQKSNSYHATKFTFTAPHGRLSWPTQGKIIQHFGTKILQSQLELTGVVLQAPAGQTIHAILPGAVVFSNWMAGYGLLLIIDDGNGYMTIYGRTQNIYKKVGDRVNAGEVIATVGNSGGYNTPALYFAIRQNGKPVNPELWCS